MMFVLQANFDKYKPEELSLIAEQIRTVCSNEQVLVIPTDVNFIQNLTNEQIEYLKCLLEKELEERCKNDL